MTLKLGLLSLVVLLISCAHNPNKIEPSDPSPSAEDGVIKTLPGASAASPTDVGLIPVEVNAEVEQWVRYFQGRGRPHFERYLERSTRYAPIMKQILKDNGVPEDLVYICMIESGFSSRIKSRAKATGFWQFMPGTGKHYGLRVNSLIDERYDPVRSTEAASAYFKGLYNLFNNWFLAIASYNVGENRVKNMVMKNYTRDFWELARRKQLPSETIHYIPKFLAASLIAREPEKYGFTGLDYQEPMVFDVVKSKDAVDMQVLAKSLKVSYDTLKDLNHSYKTQYAPVLDGEAQVRVPKGMGEAAKTALNDAVVKNKRFLAQVEEPRAKSTSFLKYKIQKGETLEAIAERFDVTVDDIIKVNRIRRSRMKPGQTIRIPSQAISVTKESKSTPPSSKKGGKSRSNVASSEDSILYTVKRGETLSHIARKHRVSMNTLAKMNNLGSKRHVFYGQKLIIPE